MKFNSLFFIALCSLFAIVSLPNLSQAQSLLLPIPGKHTASGQSCRMVDFSGSTLSTISLPSHGFSYNGNPGNPHDETHLYPSLPLMNEKYLGQHPMFAQTVVHGPAGDLLFFIVDNNIYNQYGNAFWDDLNVDYAKLHHDPIAGVTPGRYMTATTHSTVCAVMDPEIVVVPIQDRCNTFALIYSYYFSCDNTTASHVFFNTIEIIDDENIVMGNPVDLRDVYNFNCGLQCDNNATLSKAASKPRADETTSLFISYHNEVHIFTITTMGDLTHESTFMRENLNASTELMPSDNPEMEVFEIIDSQTNDPLVYRLAVPVVARTEASTSWAAFYIYDVDYSDFSLISATRINMPKVFTSNAPYEKIKGLEFSPDGSVIYVTYYGQPDIYYYDVVSQTIHALDVSNIASFQFSEIATGADGNLYFMAIDDNGIVARLNDPNTPDRGNFAVVLQSEIDELFYSYHFYNLPSIQGMTDHFSFHPEFKKLVFMDQIDASDYTSVFSTTWADCCHPYSNSIWPMTGDFDQNCTPVWTWEPGSNPFNNTYDVVRIYGDVEIPEGKKLEIKNMEFEFIKNSSLTVNKGSELVLDGTHLGSQAYCGALWQGVIVLGKLNEPQTSTDQGKVIMINNAMISDAVVGIETGDKRNSGGVIQATQSTFRNCETGIRMHPYHYMNSNGAFVQNLSFFQECTFETTVNAHPDLQPIAFMDLDGIVRLRIEGNAFRNDRGNWNILNIGRGLGIQALNTSLVILPKCTTMSSTGCTGIPNTFNKLYTAIDFTTALPVAQVATTVKDVEFTDNYRGIWANSPIGMYVTGCSFEKNYRGIYLLNSRSATVTNNTFALADICPNCTNPNTRPYGIYLDEGTGFKIEENEFGHTPVSISGGTNGIIVNNTGPQNNEIYKNYFPQTPLSVGIQAQLRNKGKDNGIDVGLQLLCNTFENPNYNIRVLGKSWVGPSTQNIGIHPAQGISDPTTNSILPADNSFSSDHTIYAPFSVDFDYSNNDAEYLLYCHDYSPTLRLEPDRSSKIGRYYVKNPKDAFCPSKVNSQSTMSQRYSDLLAAETTWKSSALIRDIWVNGGVDDLGEVLETVTPWEAYQQFNDLMSISPYVEVDALIAMIQNSSFTDLMVKLVCVANPHSSRNDAVLQALSDRTPPMPESYIEEILDESGAYSPLEQLNAQVSVDYHMYRNIQEEIKQVYRMDTLGYWVSDSLTDFLSRQEGLHDKYELAQHYLLIGQLEDFQTTLDSIPTLFNLTGQDSLDYLRYAAAFEIARDILTDSIAPGELDSLQLTNLFALIDQPGTIKIGTVLAVLYWNNRSFSYAEPILEAPVYQPRKQKTPANPTDSETTLNIYPNPASDYFTLRFSTDSRHRNIKFSIVNQQGQTIQTWVPLEHENEKLWDIGNLLSGTYSVVLHNGKTILKSQKLIIIK
jgi:parallel beta-helix repeat protein